MLMLPFTNFPYEPRISHVLSGISIYDREETLGQALWIYDPNKYEDQQAIIKNFIVPSFDYLTCRHRYLIYRLLEIHVQDTDFDFSGEFESDYDDPRVLAWDETQILDARVLNIYTRSSVSCGRVIYFGRALKIKLNGDFDCLVFSCS